jgi:hypothetical protein
MKAINYPTSTDVLHSDWSATFHFSQAFAQEMLEKFPTWEALHNAIKRDDQGRMWGFLFEYSNRLAAITPQEIVTAADGGHIRELIDRARQAVEFITLLVDLEKRHFPERIQEREEANRTALASWEY